MEPNPALSRTLAGALRVLDSARSALRLGVKMAYDLPLAQRVRDVLGQRTGLSERAMFGKEVTDR